MTNRYSKPNKKSSNNNISSKSKKNKNLIFVPTIIQLIATTVFIFHIINANVVPDKYLLPLIIILVLFCALNITLNFIKNKGLKVLNVLSSVILSIAFILGTVGISTFLSVLTNITGITYETTNMVVIVTSDNPAEDIFDASYCEFAVQTYVDTENNDLMVEEIERVLDKTIEVTSYDNMIDQATALLNGEIDAMIINDALTPLIEENLDGYLDNVKTIYSFGIILENEKETSETELDDEYISNLSISEEPFNIYISGIDTSGSISNKSRSDTNIIMSVNPVTKEILLTTTPRDYYVTFPTVTNGAYDKLTHAGIYGVDASIAALEQLYDIKIDYYVKVNFTSVVNIIDALGGVEVYSEYSFECSHLSGFYVSKGTNTMNGTQALAFSRERYAFSDGDNQRGKNQQQVIIGIINKAMSPSILTGLPSIIESVSDNFQTNLTSSEITEILKMQIDDGASWNIETISATGYDSKDSCYSLGGANAYVMEPNTESVEAVKEAIAQLFGN